jgi:peptide/nickel transport system permease protein
MRTHILKRTGVALMTMYVIITVSFILIHAMPGDPVIHLVGQEEYYYLIENDPAELERLVEKFGLNDAVPAQYAKYLKSILTLDFGISYANQRPVLENVFEAARWTLLLSVPVWILSGLLGAVLGVLAGWEVGGRFDRAATPIFLALNAIPTNCLCLVLLIVFSYRLRIFPINGMVSMGLTGWARAASIAHHMALPLICLVLFRTAGDFLLMKSAISRIRGEEYAVTALSKGLSDRKLLFRHVLRNALPPYLTSFCMQMGFLLSGSMIVEVVFGWKGMGTLMYNAVQVRDFPTAQFCFLLSALCVVGANWLGDFVNALADPTLRREDRYA